MATTRRTHCANKMPWPAGNHKSLDRFLDDAERSGAITVISEHPLPATVLALPPHQLDAATVGVVLKHADRREQAAVFPDGWRHWEQAVGAEYPDRAAAAEGFSEVTEEITPEDWEAAGDKPIDETFTAFIDAALEARTGGTSTREGLDALVATWA